MVEYMGDVPITQVLTSTPAGPELAATLAQVRVSRLTPTDRHAMLCAEDRQASHHQARRLAAMVALRATDEDVANEAGLAAGHSDERVVGEIAAALTLTRARAAADLRFGRVLLEQLPTVFDAFLAGHLNWSKAAAYVSYLGDLADAQRDPISSELLPISAELTVAQLRDRLRRRVHDIDPDHARRRYRRAVRDRTVFGYLTSDGTMTITATGLPADEAARACERLDRLVDAAVHAGHPALRGQIQTDVYLAVLEGRFQHMTEPEIIQALLAERRSEDTDRSGAPDTSSGADDRPSTGEPDVPPEEPTPRAGRPRGVAEPGIAEQQKQRHSSGRAQAPTREGLEVRVGIPTLLGLDQRYGEIAGHGPVPADVARRVVAGQVQRAQWRFAVTDAAGKLIAGGTTRYRPVTVGPTASDGTCRGGIVELQISDTGLAELMAARSIGAVAPWARILADIDRQYRSFRTRRGPTQPTGPEGGDRAHTRLIRGATARHIQMRDRICAFPGCRRPAVKSELDHPRDHTLGVLSTIENGDPLCRTHHRWRMLGGWQLSRPRPGHFQWTSPLGRTYLTSGELVRPAAIPLRPVPRDDPPARPLGKRQRIRRRRAPRPKPPRPKPPRPTRPGPTALPAHVCRSSRPRSAEVDHTPRRRRG